LTNHKIQIKNHRGKPYSRWFFDGKSKMVKAKFGMLFARHIFSHIFKKLQ
jgi:hypothetical protein